MRDTAGEVEDVQADLVPTQNKINANRNKHWKVPFFPCSSFTGRSALLQRILNYFAIHDTKSQRRFAIYGLGGVGEYGAVMYIPNDPLSSLVAPFFFFCFLLAFR